MEFNRSLWVVLMDGVAWDCWKSSETFELERLSESFLIFSCSRNYRTRETLDITSGHLLDHFKQRKRYFKRNLLKFISQATREN